MTIMKIAVIETNTNRMKAMTIIMAPSPGNVPTMTGEPVRTPWRTTLISTNPSTVQKENAWWPVSLVSMSFSWV
jgi:hypothetical protein